MDGIIAAWVAKHDLRTVLDEFEKAEAAIGPAYTIDQIFADPQYQAREDIVEVADEDLGTLRMSNAFPFMAETPGVVRHAGARKGQHNDEILCDELGLTASDLQVLKDEGVV